jgi:uncharacterized protein (TIGR02452 family)
VEDLIDAPKDGAGFIEIVDQTTTQACAESSLALNFASATNPGGGWLRGAAAQEEDICRKSTLFGSISLAEDFYNLDRNKLLYTDAFIYSPKVLIIRNEDFSLTIPRETAIITCAAPNNSPGHDPELLTLIFMRRIMNLLGAAVNFDHRHLVLGAWGCGAFANDPELVATVFKTILCDGNFAKCFDRITFAIPSGPNLKIFQDCLGKAN